SRCRQLLRPAEAPLPLWRRDDDGGWGAASPPRLIMHCCTALDPLGHRSVQNSADAISNRVSCYPGRQVRGVMAITKRTMSNAQRRDTISLPASLPTAKASTRPRSFSRAFIARFVGPSMNGLLRQPGCARSSCPRDHLAQRLARAAHNAGRPFRQAVRIALTLFGKLND